METFRSRWAAGQRALWRLPRDRDWSVIILAVAFLLVLSIPWDWSGVLQWLAGMGRSQPFAAYESAIRAAAVKTPAAAMPVTRLDPEATETEVIKFGYVGTADGKLAKGSQLTGEIFVALPDELKRRCKGASDPSTALQRVLGLPPTAGTKPAYLLKVPTNEIFRPCLSTDSVTTTICTASPPGDIATVPAGDTKHKHFDFVAGLLMKSYHAGFTRDGAQGNDYPYDGYPFTGMGYTYDWGSSGNGHFGVSEFVVERGAIISDVTPVDLGSFCAATP